MLSFVKAYRTPCVRVSSGIPSFNASVSSGFSGIENPYPRISSSLPATGNGISVKHYFTDMGPERTFGSVIIENLFILFHLRPHNQPDASFLLRAVRHLGITFGNSIIFGRQRQRRRNPRHRLIPPMIQGVQSRNQNRIRGRRYFVGWS
jgi:hypothetical protein